ncbi:MAG: DUF3307 domain-containing protein [Chloroflexi bacterium]|nr:DUF3307 domain-containing protein [Chloroflexota bacterium]
MTIAMLLAHLVGDYILQWDSLALWKSRELKGVLAHGLIVTFVTFLFILPFDPTWVYGAAFISVAHILIDAVQLRFKPPIPPLFRFILDQIAHFAVIILALTAGGYLVLPTLTADFVAILQDDRLLLYALGYAFITMPAWVLVKFAAYGLVKGSAPSFPGISNKYLGILERILITTFVMLGQFIVVPLVAAPRLALEWSRVNDGEETAVYLVELLASVALAVAIGLILSQL